jgi:hypothetical protein
MLVLGVILLAQCLIAALPLAVFFTVRAYR